MKKFLTGLTLASLLALPVVVAAQEEIPPMTGEDMIIALENLANWLFTLALIIAVIFLVIFPISMLTAQGDLDKVAKARNYIIYALIGVAVAVAAKGLVALVRLIMGF